MGIDVSKDYNIGRLQQWLDYELSTVLLFFLSWFWTLMIVLMGIAAILFTPLMLKILFQERKFGWITFFLILVVIPLIVIQFLDIEPNYKFAMSLIPFALFYFYCFLLRFAVRDWLH